jgi:hypothetical protein
MRQHKSAMNTEEISCILEPLIRRIIREELERMVQKEQKMFFLKSDSPLYDDLVEISSRTMEGKTNFIHMPDVWGE